MKIQGTCANAADLLDEIKECLVLVAHGEAPTFQTDLESRLVREVLAELCAARFYGWRRVVPHSRCVSAALPWHWLVGSTGVIMTDAREESRPMLRNIEN